MSTTGRCRLFSFNVKTDFGGASMGEELQRRIRLAQFWFDKEVIRQTEPFVPRDKGDLMASAHTATELGSGKIVYAMPYARRLYYGESFNFSRDKHPQATHHWFDKAKSIFLDYWGEGIAKIMGGKWRRA